MDKVLDLDKLAKQYRDKKIGYIATGYIKEQEEAVYLAASKILASKYPNIVTANELYSILNSKGKIYTIHRCDGDRRKGLFDGTKRANILIPYFIRKMTENLLHELIHKIGFLRADNTFLKMNEDIRETGTEIVASSSMSTKFGKTKVLPNVYGKFPENAYSDLLTYSLINQLNLLTGEETLEKTILGGHDYFKEEIVSKYGSDFYKYISTQISLISDKANMHYEMANELGINNEKVSAIGKEFFQDIKLFEDKILKQEFDQRFLKIDSLDAGKHFLEQLNNFGENRLQEKNENGQLVDKNLEEIFNKYKEKIEKIYGKTNIEFRNPDIDKLPNLAFEENLEDDELIIIEQMAMDFQKESKARLKEQRRLKFKKFFYNTFGIDYKEKNKALPEATSNFDERVRVENLSENTSEIIKKEKPIDEKIL